MSTFKSVRDINFGGQIVPTGKVLQFEEKDAAFVQRLLDKGSIVKVTEEPAAEEAVVTPPVAEATASAPVIPTADEIAQDLKDAGV